MRYELTDYEWAAIKPMLPNKPRGVHSTPANRFEQAERCADRHKSDQPKQIEDSKADNDWELKRPASANTSPDANSTTS
jgi:hypothetical protein